MPATLASRVRVLGTGRSNKNDPNDAPSVAVAALRSPGLRRWSRRPLGGAAAPGQAQHRPRQPRTQVVCRLHALVRRALPGRDRQGAVRLRRRELSRPSSSRRPPVEQHPLRPRPRALDDVRRLDAQLKASHRRIRDRDQGLGHLADRALRHRTDLAASSSATPATSPLRDRDPSPPTTARHRSSSLRAGGLFHRLSRRGTASSTMRSTWSAICQIRKPGTEGRDLLRAQGRRGQDQERGAALAQAPRQQRRLPPAASSTRQIAGPGGHSGRLVASVTGFYTLIGRLFGEVTPGPIEPYAAASIMTARRRARKSPK